MYYLTGFNQPFIVLDSGLDSGPLVYYILLMWTEITGSSLFFYILNIFILLTLLLLSALVSGSEVAFFSLSREEILKCKRSSIRRERNLAGLLDAPRRLLATILILNNLFNIAIVTLSTYITWHWAGTKSTTGSLIVALTFIVTFLIVFFGEVTPKVYAFKYNLSFAKKTTNLLFIANYVFWPISRLLIALSNLVEKRIEKKGYEISADRLHQAIEITIDKNSTQEEREILKGIVNFGNISVKQIVCSRIDITAFDIESSFDQLMNDINKCVYSRIPVYRDTIDNIEGMLYVKDLLPYIDQNNDFEWQKLLRKPYFIPESKKIDDLLKDFQDKHVHIAIVVDEYGGTSGLITLEDIIEEIVGEIHDEFDQEDQLYTKLDNNTFIFEGKTSLNDFCRIVDERIIVFEKVKGENESLGGLLLELFSKLPKEGDTINFDKYHFEIESVDTKRIKKVRVQINEDKGEK